MGQPLDRSLTIRAGILAAWLAAVVLVVLAIFRQDVLFRAKEVPKVAVLESRTGTVLVRPHGLVRWANTVDLEALHDGDRLAVGRGGRARVDFGGGRVLVIGEDSQIEIKTIQNLATKDFGFTIQLVRGSLVADVKPDAKHVDDGSLRVEASGKRYDLVQLKASGLYKAAGDKGIKRFEVPKSAEPAPPPQLALADPEPVEEAEPPEASELAPAPALAPAKARGFEADVRPPAAGLVYWTAQPLSALNSQALDFPVAPPAGHPRDGEWRPALELSGGGKGKTEVITAGARDGVIRVSIMKIRNLAAVKMHGGLKEYAFTARGGDEVTHDKSKDTSFGEHRLSGRILTFGEYAGGPVTLGFDRLAAAEAKTGPWLDPKQMIDAGTAPVQVRLALAGDYNKLMPYMRGAGQVGVDRQGPGTDGMFVVRDQQVVAQLGGGGVKAEDANTVMTALGGEFVFKGPRSALADTRASAKANGNGLVGYVGALLDKGNVLYILKRDKLYKVSRDFIKTNDDVAKFIDSQARAIFLQDVEIVAYR